MGKPEHRARQKQLTTSAGFRSLRLEQLILEEIRSILDGEVNDPRLEGVRPTRVELSRDGSRARIWVACMTGNTSIVSDPPRAADVLAALERATRFFRARLCDDLALKRVPELTFRLDPVHLETATIHSGTSASPLVSGTDLEPSTKHD